MRLKIKCKQNKKTLSPDKDKEVVVVTLPSTSNPNNQKWEGEKSFFLRALPPYFFPTKVFNASPYER